MQNRTDKLRGQVWRHLELGQWHSAALLAERMIEIDPLSGLSGLAEATRALAIISEAIRLNEPVDPHVLVRLEEMGRTWPRLAAMRSFQALTKAVEEASTNGHEVQTSMPNAAAQGASPKTAASSGPKPRRSILRRMVRPEGCSGIAASLCCILAVMVVFNCVAYWYLRGQPESTDGPERGTAALTTLPPWHTLMDLESPVDTIILGDSTARVDLITGPFADRLGGDVLNLANNAGSSVLMDAWMLQYYLDKFGAPRNVILLRNCHGYEYTHSVEFMSAVPLQWGYWDRLGVAPAWGTREQLELMLSKYNVLYSASDILSDRLRHPLDLLAQPYKKRDVAPYYSQGSVAESELDMFRRGNTATTYSPFHPSADGENAVSAMSEQAGSLGFQLYFVVGPEWDEAYQDPDRQAKVSAMVEWMDQFTDPQYVHILLRSPLVYRADQMQNINHLRPGAERQYSEAVVGEMVAVQNGLTGTGAVPLRLSSTVLDKSGYVVEEQPRITLSLTADNASIDAGASVAGEVSCLVRWAGMSDSKWVCRAPAVAFSVASGSSSELVLVPDVGKLPMAGTYDLVVFIRQDVSGLSYETRTEIPKAIRVS